MKKLENINTPGHQASNQISNSANNLYNENNFEQTRLCNLKLMSQLENLRNSNQKEPAQDVSNFQSVPLRVNEAGIYIFIAKGMFHNF